MIKKIIILVILLTAVCTNTIRETKVYAKNNSDVKTVILEKVENDQPNDEITSVNENDYLEGEEYAEEQRRSPLLFICIGEGICILGFLTYFIFLSVKYGSIIFSKQDKREFSLTGIAITNEGKMRNSNEDNFYLFGEYRKDIA